MQAIQLTPLAQPLSGEWAVPGSKSITNRALILAALAPGMSILQGVLSSDDTKHMINGLQKLGIGIQWADETTLVVQGGRERLHPSDEPLFIGNSGTSVRFLAALACLVPGSTTLVGDEHMAKRPLQDLLDGLAQLGITYECATGCPPLTIHGGHLSGGTVHMRGDRSSQYFSALLMAGALADNDIKITIDGTLVSRPYVEMTIRMMTVFGAQVENIQNNNDEYFLVRHLPGYRNLSYRIEPDASAASYPLALAAAGTGSVRIPHLSGDALQGDVAFIDVLRDMGAEAEKTPHYIQINATKKLRGITVDMFHISDTVMTLAAIAPLCEGPTRIENIANIRIKETDRLAATVNELRKLGQKVEHGDDWLEITPSPITPADIECYSDHRMAMSFAVLGLLHEGVNITDPACVSKTYPDFWDDCAKVYTQQGQLAPWISK